MDKKVVRIGWIGSPSTTKYLAPLNDVFITLYNKHGTKVSFEIMGANKELLKFEKGQFYDWTYEKELDFLRNLDIGLMPLFNDEWSRGKGGYKLLQYMATGIPSVASSIGTNVEIVEDRKTGFLVNEMEEWIERLDFLINNPEERKKMGILARKRVEEKFSIENNVSKVIDCLNHLFTASQKTIL